MPNPQLPTASSNTLPPPICTTDQVSRDIFGNFRKNSTGPSTPFQQYNTISNPGVQTNTTSAIKPYECSIPSGSFIASPVKGFHNKAVANSANASGIQFRSKGPVRKLSVDLIKTYKNINEVYYRKMKKENKIGEVVKKRKYDFSTRHLPLFSRSHLAGSKQKPVVRAPYHPPSRKPDYTGLFSYNSDDRESTLKQPILYHLFSLYTCWYRTFILIRDEKLFRHTLNRHIGKISKLRLKRLGQRNLNALDARKHCKASLEFFVVSYWCEFCKFDKVLFFSICTWTRIKYLR